MNPRAVFIWTQTDSSGYNSYGAVDIGEPTKILIYNIVPCHQMIQVYNSKAVGAEDVELGTRVRSHVPNVILQTFSLGIATISGAPSARVCTRASEIVFRFLVYRYRTDHRQWRRKVFWDGGGGGAKLLIKRQSYKSAKKRNVFQ